LALKEYHLRQVAGVIEMLTRAVLVDKTESAIVNLEKAQALIGKILNPLRGGKQGKKEE
jgi:hypothetical protein